MPRGIDRAGDARSPDMLAPAMMPVTAGKKRANIVIALSPGSYSGQAAASRVAADTSGRAPAKKEASDSDQHRQDSVLQLDRPAGADVDAQEHQEIHDRAEHAWRETEVREAVQERLREADHVHRNRDRLGDEEHESDRAAELHAEAAADQEVGAAALDAGIGRDRGEREGRQRGDQLRDDQDADRRDEPRLTRHLAEAAGT